MQNLPEVRWEPADPDAAGYSRIGLGRLTAAARRRRRGHLPGIGPQKRTAGRCRAVPDDVAIAESEHGHGAGPVIDGVSLRQFVRLAGLVIVARD